ncbi:hypothetical protein B4U80_08851, partial [Leptotrombidium deliense]
MDSLGSYKRNGNTVSGSRNAIMNKQRQQVPPDGASSLIQPRSPRFSDRYKHRAMAAQHVSTADAGNDWFD